MNDKQRLKELEGKEFDTDEIICCMMDLEEYVHIEFSYKYSVFEEYAKCKLYYVYYDTKDSEAYNIYVDENNMIAFVE